MKGLEYLASHSSISVEGSEEQNSFVYGLFRCIEWEIIGVFGDVVPHRLHSKNLVHRVTIYLRTKHYQNLDFDTAEEAMKAHAAVSEVVERNNKITQQLLKSRMMVDSNLNVTEQNNEGN